MNFWEILELTQEYISRTYSSLLTDKTNLRQLKAYIETHLRENNYYVEDLTLEELTNKIYEEMAEYSLLTQYLGEENLEEINVNAWNDIALTYTSGDIIKAKECFKSPSHAVDIVKRLLNHSNMIIDNATPIAQGHLPNNSRITAMKEPIVDDTVGISASIRLLHPQKITVDSVIKTNTATKEMIGFLSMCLCYGISTVIAGATSSGKTTLLNALLQSCIPPDKRVFTIESGSRELSLISEENGVIKNNVVHTLARPSDNPTYNITQEQLVVASLRFNPDIIAVGEMRDVECYSAVESSLTGHTVVSTVHSGPAAFAHMRIGLLCQKRFPIDFNISLMQAGQAFPIVVFTHQVKDKSRKIMDISECIIDSNGKRSYKTLYRYRILENTYEDNNIKTIGVFEKRSIMSESLQNKLIQYGVSQKELDKYIKIKE